MIITVGFLQFSFDFAQTPRFSDFSIYSHDTTETTQNAREQWQGKIPDARKRQYIQFKKIPADEGAAADNKWGKKPAHKCPDDVRKMCMCV